MWNRCDRFGGRTFPNPSRAQSGNIAKSREEARRRTCRFPWKPRRNSHEGASRGLADATLRSLGLLQCPTRNGMDVGGRTVHFRCVRDRILNSVQYGRQRNGRDRLGLGDTPQEFRRANAMTTNAFDTPFPRFHPSGGPFDQAFQAITNGTTPSDDMPELFPGFVRLPVITGFEQRDRFAPLRRLFRMLRIELRHRRWRVTIRMTARITHGVRRPSGHISIRWQRGQLTALSDRRVPQSYRPDRAARRVAGSPARSFPESSPRRH